MDAMFSNQKRTLARYRASPNHLQLPEPINGSIFAPHACARAQDIAPFAADVRRLSVIFISLWLDLESPDESTVEQAHQALLAIQKAIYRRKGTLRQFLQDDKGLLAIAVNKP
jgi:hypothetical protein